MKTGYKCFDKNLMCRDFQYEVGKTYIHDGEIAMCKSGFHFCGRPSNLFNYNEFDSANRVCVIEYDENNTIHQRDKSVTSKIKIVKELTWEQVLNLVNTGNWNLGYKNSGNGNSGNGNSGNNNSGNWNSGYGNSGHKNSGDGNSGNQNSGHANLGGWNSGHKNSGDINSGNGNLGNRNSGNKNSGNWNSGDYNSGGVNSGSYNSGSYSSGNWNSANYSSGIFCSKDQPLFFFNKPVNFTMKEFLTDAEFSEIRTVVYDYELPLNYWLAFDEMTPTQKENFKEYEFIGGVLLSRDYKDACEIWWNSIPSNLKQKFINWEYFDASVFEDITGIKVK